jgi:DNA-binding NarL/FixJ family response regulator
VLIVDDDARVREGLHRLLATAEDLVVVAVAADGIRAREQVSGARDGVDVALVDVALPTRAAGLQLIRELSLAVPVIALSITGGEREAALGAGAHRYLEKGGDPDELLSALRAAAGDRPRPAREPGGIAQLALGIRSGVGGLRDLAARGARRG